MKVVIFGASGRTGRELVRQALALGHQVTAYVRDPDKLGASDERLVVIVGTLDDEQSLARAVAGQDAVVSALGVGRPLRSDPAVREGLARILEAMRRASVRRLVYLSFAGVRESRPHAGRLIRHVLWRVLRNEVADHERKEELIRRSALDWTIVRAPKLTNGPATGAYRGGEGIRADALLPSLARADVAQFMLGQLGDPAFIQKAPSVLP